MTESELELLLQDLLALRELPGFGSAFAFSLVEADRYDRLVFQVRGADGGTRRLLVELADYLAVTPPVISARQADDAASVQTAAQAQAAVAAIEKPMTIVAVLMALRDSAENPQTNLLQHPIQKIVVANGLAPAILKDAKKYWPNEYAYLCSGFVGADGTATVTNYYAGEMSVSTPVYCELTDAFVEKTVYDVMPQAHSLIVWGHVHPIESPSATDLASFADLAVWDKEVQALGAIRKRSVALLVSSMSQRLSFWDVHTQQQIAHSEEVAV